jgi:hypothetical protein
MNRAQKFAIIYLVLIVAVGYGYAVGRFKVFPYKHIEPMVQDYQKFAAGDSMEKTSSVVSKLKNDLGISPDRWIYTYPPHAADNAVPAPYPTLEKRGQAPLVYVDENQRSGYRVIVGAMDMPEAFWGALLLNPQGEIIHSWNLSTAHLPATAPSEQLKNLYGLHVFPDGSIIYTMQERGGGIVRVDACSNVLWSLKGEFHHSTSPDETGHFWTFIGKQSAFDQNMAKISVDAGEIVEIIDMAKVRDANPDLHIWDLYPYSFFESRGKIKKSGEMAHGNNIEPLPQSLAADFPQFKPGDLLISYATTNLIFVLDPVSLKVKWWRVGISDLQHDPDWEPGGKISILSNNPRSGKSHSDIVTVDPATMEYEVTLNGASLDFMTIINGRHQLTEFGTRFVTSSQQGWAFEVDQQGKILFSFVNNVNAAERKAMHLSEALRYPEAYFTSEFWKACER